METLASTPFAVFTPQLEQKFAASESSVPQLRQKTMFSPIQQTATGLLKICAQVDTTHFCTRYPAALL